MKFLNSVFKDKDGNADEHVCGMALGWLALLSFQGIALYHGQPFDPQGFAIGFGAVGAAGGCGKMLAGKDHV